MPLQKLQFRPGVNREGTTLSNEGGWFECDKVRFRSGYPEKIGGWVKDLGTTSSTLQPPSGAFWGICRSLANWVTLAGANLVSAGTNLKFYIQNSLNGSWNDVTPIRQTDTNISNAFTTSLTTPTIVTVNDPGHGAQTGDFVTISGVSGPVNGIPADSLNAEFQITYLTSSTYTITLASGAATSAGTAGTATFAYQITTGLDVYSVQNGWGAGGWGGVTAGSSDTGWGEAASTGVGVQLRLWSEANYGQNLIFNPRGSAMYYWSASSNPNIYNRGAIMKAGDLIPDSFTVYYDSTTPSVANFVLVSDGSRFVIAFGTNDPTGQYATVMQDPMQIRWSQQEEFYTWTPAVTNQAGDYRLSRGSQIVAAQQTRQEILVFTDAAVYSMQYLGPPYVWGFQIMGDNTSIAGPNVVSVVNNITYWMGTDKFYMYSGRVETLPCTLRQYVFDDINMTQAYQFFSGTNEGYNEIWWFYCSSGSTVVDKYVVFNHLEHTWYYGTLPRTAWLDSPLRATPMSTSYTFLSFTGAISGTTLTVTGSSGSGLGVGSVVVGVGVPTNTKITALGTGTGGDGTYTINQSTTLSATSMAATATSLCGQLLYQENGNDDGSVTPALPIEAYVQSSDFDIGDGHNFGIVWRIIPDVTFDGSNVAQPSVTFTVRPRENPGSGYGLSDEPTVTSKNNYGLKQTYNVQQFTQYAYVRARGRQMALRVGSSDAGVAWQLGSPRLDVRPDGRR